MAVFTIVVAVLVCSMVAEAQRPFYAGLRSIGYPEIQSNALTNKFSENEYAPIEARGDRRLLNRLYAMPEDKQPFWLLNWRQYRNMRERPQTYPLRPSIFSNRI